MDAIAANIALRWMLKYLLFSRIGLRYHGTATERIDFERCDARFVDDLHIWYGIQKSTQTELTPEQKHFQNINPKTNVHSLRVHRSRRFVRTARCFTAVIHFRAVCFERSVFSETCWIRCWYYALPPKIGCVTLRVQLGRWICRVVDLRSLIVGSRLIVDRELHVRENCSFNQTRTLTDNYNNIIVWARSLRSRYAAAMLWFWSTWKCNVVLTDGHFSQWWCWWWWWSHDDDHTNRYL